MNRRRSKVVLQTTELLSLNCSIWIETAMVIVAKALRRLSSISSAPSRRPALGRYLLTGAASAARREKVL